MVDSLEKDPNQCFPFSFPDTLIKSCVHYCIIHQRMEKQKSEINTNLKVAIHCYRQYADSIMSEQGSKNWYEYWKGLCLCLLREDKSRYDADYCIHH